MGKGSRLLFDTINIPSLVSATMHLPLSYKYGKVAIRIIQTTFRYSLICNRFWSQYFCPIKLMFHAKMLSKFIFIFIRDKEQKIPSNLWNATRPHFRVFPLSLFHSRFSGKFVFPWLCAHKIIAPSLTFFAFLLPLTTVHTQKVTNLFRGKVTRFPGIL